MQLPVKTVVQKSERRTRRGRSSNHKYLRSRQAARALGLSESLLLYLRKNGHFEIQSAGSWSIGYSLEDLHNFEKKVAELPLIDSLDVSGIELRKLLLRKVKGEGRGVLLAAVLDGRIGVLRRNGPSMSDLVVHAAHADCLLKSMERTVYGGTLSTTEAGKIVELPPMAIASFCAQGLIRGYRCTAGFRIHPGAAEEFHAEYVALAQVAAEVDSGAKWAIQIARSLGVEMFRDPVVSHVPVVIRRKDAPAVLAKMQETPRRRHTPRGVGTKWEHRRLRRASTEVSSG